MSHLSRLIAGFVVAGLGLAVVVGSTASIDPGQAIVPKSAAADRLDSTQVLPSPVPPDTPADASKFTPELVKQLEESAPANLVSCLVFMSEKYPYAAVRNDSRQDKIATFRSVAQNSQAPVVAALAQWGNAAEVKEQFWVVNGFHLLATPDVIRWLSKRPEVAAIADDAPVFLVDAGTETTAGATDTPRWNIDKVSAPDCWTAGYDGQGVVIAQTDTGVDTAHPALAGRFTGYWHDSIAGSPAPTTTTGMVRTPWEPRSAWTVGVAPGATFVAVKVLNAAGKGSSSQTLNGLQWVASLHATVDIKVMSASWGSPSRTDQWAWNVCQTYKSIGILPVFANGNDGPGGATVGTPADYPLVLGVELPTPPTTSPVSPAADRALRRPGASRPIGSGRTGISPSQTCPLPASAFTLLAERPVPYAGRHLHGHAARCRRGRDFEPGETPTSIRPSSTKCCSPVAINRAKGTRIPTRITAGGV